MDPDPTGSKMTHIVHREKQYLTKVHKNTGEASKRHSVYWDQTQ